MSDTTLAAIKTGPSTTELRELALPDIPPDAALLKVEVAGVCGTDVSQYRLPLRGGPIIMGHENVGYLAKVGREFAARKGVKEGDLMFLEHYLPCGHCEWDHMGEYRHCAATEWFYDPTAIRYGYTSMDTAPGLWGGFSHYLYLPLNAVLHNVPAGLTAEEAGVATPMSNGIQWALMDGGVGYASTVLIQGPGQQGLCCAMASKQAGAARVMITGMTKDARRLEVAKSLGADDVINVQEEDALARVMEITGGRGVDVVIDCTVGAGPAPTLLGIEATKRRGGTMVVQGEGNQEFPNFPIGRLTRKGMTLKSARGHSYRAVELALYHLGARRFPLELMTTHRFGLAEVDYAIKSVGGQGAPGAIHVSVMPWR
ncbi:MAG: alcohol dehydrogenase catalytic domain-containing protein [Acidobacteria bacterium]|nr:alcohol dehydrogenase catalytic domain-containing protein [Acidobacteriota bacterium]